MTELKSSKSGLPKERKLSKDLPTFPKRNYDPTSALSPQHIRDPHAPGKIFNLTTMPGNFIDNMCNVIGICGGLRSTFEAIQIELPRTGESKARLKWLSDRVGNVTGEINRRKLTLAMLTLELNKAGYAYEPRQCEHCGHWMVGQPVVIGGQFQGMSDRCFVCETGNPMKDVPLSSLNLSGISKGK